MKGFWSAVREFWVSEAGPTAVEYALMVALIAVIVIVGAFALGTNSNQQLQNVANVVKDPKTAAS